MCDLWKNTLTESVPQGAIPAQIDYALARLEPARHIKLYNSGSFFDPRAIPVEDYPAIAERVADFERVIVECHPALIGEKIGENCFRFKEILSGPLEVAMGLETAHPAILEKLNKRMTTDQFAAAAARLREHGIDLRVFILVKPPFMREDEALCMGPALPRLRLRLRSHRRNPHPHPRRQWSHGRAWLTRRFLAAQALTRSKPPTTTGSACIEAAFLPISGT